MELIKIFKLEDFISVPIQLTIQGSGDEDKPTWIEKKIQSVKNCPDSTHVRLYFDNLHFIAFPKESEVEITTMTWSAHDKKGNLRYLVKKGEAWK